MRCRISFGIRDSLLINKNYCNFTLKSKVLGSQRIFLDEEFDSLNKKEKGFFSFSKEKFNVGIIIKDVSGDIENKSFEAYNTLLASLGKNKAYRFWNFVPKINFIENGEEIYKKFNAGRNDAFRNFFGREYKKHLPAATGIDILGNKLIIILISGKERPSYLANPQQISSYNYPKQYGIKSPNFSRATEIRNKFYFISGTASIKNHSSMYNGDIKKQFKLMKENLNIMLSQNKTLSKKDDSFAIIYIRNKKDFGFVKKQFDKSFNFVKRKIYLQANVCRSDLDVEAEITLRK